MLIKTENVCMYVCMYVCMCVCVCACVCVYADTHKHCDPLCDRAVLSSGRMPHDKQNHNILTATKIWS
jgi:hypothetical protein